jgi:hypothetical protein
MTKNRSALSLVDVVLSIALGAFEQDISQRSS